MGLTVSSVGRGSIDSGLEVCRRSPGERMVALAGNPNVGKSTIFNALTGMRQHTGNWPGKTVASALGRCASEKRDYVLVDIPGAYSLMSHSAEEEVARDFLCFGGADAVIVVCDATCLARNLNLALQIMEVSRRVVLCVNLVDEARKKGIEIDFKRLSQALGIPVVPTVARKRRTLSGLLRALDAVIDGPEQALPEHWYPQSVEHAIATVQAELRLPEQCSFSARWAALQLLNGDESMLREISSQLGRNPLEEKRLAGIVAEARQGGNHWKDAVAEGLTQATERFCEAATIRRGSAYGRFERRTDRFLTGRWTAFPVMLGMLAVIFWLTIAGANAPSRLLAAGLFRVQDWLTEVFLWLHAPDWLHGALVLGAYRTLAWVVSVMLPPMAIFFPLFTLLEDSGFLPRIAYNLDRPFKCCCACGKQALTMCMGFGCNAAGVVGCRIIDSPRERLIAILTNSFVPCNGRFPMLIALITILFAWTAGSAETAAFSALALTALILLGVGMTLFASWALSKTVLKGMPSSFTLELPPYRRPQLGSVIVRSLLDRTLFVLGRAVAVAAPVGLLIWILANASVGGATLLDRLSGALDPFARAVGLDGVILMAFLLGLPANEIVLPIALMAYTAQGSLAELSSTADMQRIFVENGWTWKTALCTMLFAMFHWPCSTTLLTIRKETGSWKWTLLALLLPTAAGLLLCFMVTSVF